MKLVRAVAVLAVLIVAGLGRSDAWAAEITAPNHVRLRAIPPTAAIVFIQDRRNSPARPSPFHDVYVTTEDGRDITQITFNSKPRHYEHAAVSPDRKMVAANYWVRDPNGGRRSLLLILDLERKTEAQLVPRFYSAGDGGIDWDHRGFIYFAAVPTKAAPRTVPTSDIYRIRYDGTYLQQLTSTTELEKDVSVSEDGTMLVYVRAVPKPPRGHTEIWLANTDGTKQKLVYRSGAIRVNSAHDPELSPDNKSVVFSRVNPNFKNFPRTYNTAHDLYVINVDGTNLQRLTAVGGIQIVPDWLGDRILYTDMNEADGYIGMAISDTVGAHRRRFGPAGARMPKWIPTIGSGHR